MKRSYWLGKRVFIIGQTSFVGVWLSFLLRQMGAKVSGFGSLPDVRPNLFSMSRVDSLITSVIGDVRSWESLLSTLSSRQPDAIIYLEGSWAESAQTSILNYISFNAVGVMNALEAASKNVMVPHFIFAKQQMMAADKTLAAVTEKMIDDIFAIYRARYDGLYQTLTYPLPIGGGDWGSVSTFGSLMTDAQQATVAADILQMPWLHALDICAGIIDMLEAHDNTKLSRTLMSDYLESYNLSWLFQRLREERVANHDANRIWQRHQETLRHAQPSKNNDKKTVNKAAAEDNWKPCMGPEQAMHLTASFYGELAQGKQCLDVIRQQCIHYMQEYSLEQIDNGELDLVSLASR